MSTLKPLGCRVLLLPFPDMQRSAGGIFAPNTYQKANTKFRVEAIGPGEWVSRGKKRKPVFVQPECAVGDMVISHHWLEDAKPGWHKTVHIDREDQSSRVFVDCRQIRAVIPLQWDEVSDIVIHGQFASMFGTHRPSKSPP